MKPHPLKKVRRNYASVRCAGSWHNLKTIFEAWGWSKLDVKRRFGIPNDAVENIFKDRSFTFDKFRWFNDDRKTKPHGKSALILHIFYRAYMVLIHEEEVIKRIVDDPGTNEIQLVDVLVGVGMPNTTFADVVRLRKKRKNPKDEKDLMFDGAFGVENADS